MHCKRALQFGPEQSYILYHVLWSSAGFVRFSLCKKKMSMAIPTPKILLHVTFTILFNQGRSQKGAGAECPPPLDGKKFWKISHTNWENQGKWEEKGKIWKKIGSLPGACPCGQKGLATALFLIRLTTKIWYILQKSPYIIMPSRTSCLPHHL